MKKFQLNLYKLSLVLFISLAGCSGVLKTSTTESSKQRKPGAPVELKVMTYNVHHCNPPSKAQAGTIDLAAVTKVIASASPDIVFLQEIDVHTSRSGKDINQAEAIAKQLGMNYYFGKALDFGGGEYGIAILSRFQLTDPKVYLLPKKESIQSEQRALLTATATLENRLKLRIACTHMDYVSPENRILQYNKISEVLKNETLPVVLGGDFNDTLNSKEMSDFTKTFKSLCRPCLPTDPSDLPEKTIDYILTDRNHSWKVLSYFVGEDSYASDHRPVFSTISLR
ncbi:endonuclease/exonuclease/phosphatase family protein [Chitinophagaceae bacterium LB-8]|uniref:Endonuclease/exonuclease/phosphatase family protein n=1 Tax=Paraflavisolibacter caeni TaxID=2982496 RepID=A0A9X2XWG5_9BACT|nr:endonuclease/exonuclease/phosphatase family protein [Paraflavisolibacter caeni]MCU7550511.1 endonuclease/exonuclease/phosphatase family protein [Paraflavisolibacter caeni]